MKLSGRYSPGLYAGVGGILTIVAINSLSIPNSLQAQLEQTRAETARKVADAYSENNIANVDELIISDYTLNNNPPKIDWQNTVDKTQKTFVYDKFRRCVGYAYQGKFLFVKYYNEGICENATR
jgi:hypothetical protein